MLELWALSLATPTATPDSPWLAGSPSLALLLQNVQSVARGSTCQERHAHSRIHILTTQHLQVSWSLFPLKHQTCYHCQADRCGQVDVVNLCKTHSFTHPFYEFTKHQQWRNAALVVSFPTQDVYFRNQQLLKVRINLLSYSSPNLAAIPGICFRNVTCFLWPHDLDLFLP